MLRKERVGGLGLQIDNVKDFLPSLARAPLRALQRFGTRGGGGKRGGAADPPLRRAMTLSLLGQAASL